MNTDKREEKRGALSVQSVVQNSQLNRIEIGSDPAAIRQVLTAPRTFRLDRMQTLVPTQDPLRLPPNKKRLAKF